MTICCQVIIYSREDYNKIDAGILYFGGWYDKKI